MFALIKRQEERDENLASYFYSILLSTKTILLLFVLRYTKAKDLFLSYPYNFIFKIFIIFIFIIWYFVCKNYFIKQGNYRRINSYYEALYMNKNKRMALVGIIYCVFTFTMVIAPSFFF
jgi:hypothetical protein